MKTTRKSSVCRGSSTEDQLRGTPRMARAGMAVRGAADIPIPRWTLRDHIKTGMEIKKMARNSILTRAQENELCNIIFRLASIGYPLSGTLIRRSGFASSLENVTQILPRAKHSLWIRPELHNMKSRFWATGKCIPLIPIIILDDAFAPSEGTFRKDLLVNNENVASTFVVVQIEGETEPQPGPSVLNLKKKRSWIARERQNSSFSVHNSDSNSREIDNHDDQDQE